MDSPTNLPAAGLHYGVPFETYKLWPAANISTLKPIRKTPAHCRWQMDHPRESAEMDVGSALHISILEPARFDRDFYIATEYDGRTKEGKAIAAQCEEEAAGRTIIRRKPGVDVDADDVTGMAESVWRNAAAKRFLSMPGQCEVSAVWQDPATGLMCKGRFDKLITAQRPIILEIKTTKDASEFSFSSDCNKLGYAAQARYYIDGHKALTGVEPLHLILAIENKGPWAPRLWTLDDAALHTGGNQYRRWLDDYAACLKASNWPGYPEEVRTLSLPHWATNDNNE